ncbi:hypothetical protein KAZ57_03565 [Patescibacteria group bacterium]|nr:hypothetical protein [Patescibacteria group bacterium]
MDLYYEAAVKEVLENKLRRRSQVKKFYFTEHNGVLDGDGIDTVVETLTGRIVSLQIKPKRNGSEAVAAFKKRQHHGLISSLIRLVVFRRTASYSYRYSIVSYNLDECAWDRKTWQSIYDAFERLRTWRAFVNFYYEGENVWSLIPYGKKPPRQIYISPDEFCLILQENKSALQFVKSKIKPS